MTKLVLLRHGQSAWNLSNRFTGWTDVDLTDQGRQEARDAGRLLKEGGYVFDVAYTTGWRVNKLPGAFSALSDCFQ